MKPAGVLGSHDSIVSQTISLAYAEAEWLNYTLIGEQENKMTSKLDVIKAWTDGPIDMEASAGYIADDFQFLDQDGNVVMDKASYLGMGHMMVASFRDLKYVRTDLREEGDFVIMSGHFEGTHTSDFDLSAMGMGIIPASGKKIVWPDSSDKITVEGGKIVKMEQYGESGGMEAFLAPIMEEVPSK